MRRIMANMNRISRAQGMYRAAHTEGEIPPCQHSFVLAICASPGLSQDALSRRLCLNKSTVARALAGMEEAGLVTRTPYKEDKRVLLVEPTERMLALLPEVKRVAREWNDVITADIDEAEMDVFCAVLEKLALHAREAVGLAEGEI